MGVTGLAAAHLIPAILPTGSGNHNAQYRSKGFLWI
jgi:hypothetical protein